MTKRIKLSFSIEEILRDTRKDKIVSPTHDPPRTTGEQSLCLSTQDTRHDHRYLPTQDSRHAEETTFPSPGSDGNNSDDDGKTRKRKRTRTTFSSAQVFELEKKFQRSQYLSAVDRLNLAASLSMSDVQVKRWFQNRRCKERHRVEDLHKTRSSLFLYQDPYFSVDTLLLQKHLTALFGS